MISVNTISNNTIANNSLSYAVSEVYVSDIISGNVLKNKFEYTNWLSEDNYYYYSNLREDNGFLILDN